MAIVILAGSIPLTRSQAQTRLTGEAAPLSSPLALWYRAPASDHAPDPPSSIGRGANAEWVRALPIGNGRLGAMVFGGIVHHRLQLNEDTLWAGRPYDPVNPDARKAIPEVRRLLSSGLCSDAAKLVGEEVLAQPLAQMPYQTLGDLILTFLRPRRSTTTGASWTSPRRQPTCRTRQAVSRSIAKSLRARRIK